MPKATARVTVTVIGAEKPTSFVRDTVFCYNCCDAKYLTPLATNAFNAMGLQKDDASTAAGTTWSSTKINSQINAAIAALVNGAPGSSDTLKELADQLAALVQADTGLLSFAGAQTLTAGQKTQGCTNLGVGEPETDFVSVFNTGLQ